MKVLVTSAGALLGQGIIRSLQQCKYNPDIIACDPDPRSPGLYWTKYCRLLPFAKDPNFIDKFFELLNEERPDAVCIGTDMELSLLSAHKDELETAVKTKIIVSNPEVIRIEDDKYLTYKFMKNNGFEVPASCLPGKEEELIEKCDFPLIVKPRIGARSVGVYKVKNKNELEIALTKISNPVIQQCVADNENEYTAGTN